MNTLSPTAGYAIKEGVTVGFKASEYPADMASHPEGDCPVSYCSSCLAKNCPGVIYESGAPETADWGSVETSNFLVSPPGNCDE